MPDTLSMATAMTPTPNPPAPHNTTGQSRRMGRDKALLPWGQQRLVDHGLRLLQQQCARVLLSSNSTIAQLPATVPQLPDTLPDAGPLGGLLTGLEWLNEKTDDEWLLSCAVDTPGAPADLLPRLAAGWQAGCQIVIPVYRQRLHPTCSLWHRSLAQPLRDYLEAGERRMLRFIDRTPHALTAFDDAPSDPFANLNTPEEFAAQRPPPHPS